MLVQTCNGTFRTSIEHVREAEHAGEETSMQ